DVATPCNKRQPGSGCSAVGGVTRIHAILGASDQCIATHPSDMCVALAALEAKVNVVGPGGPRSMAFRDFHRLPGETPHLDNNLASGELITSIELPQDDFSQHYSYLKIRDRLAYAFALVSVAAALRIEDGRISAAHIALGGVAHKPWRCPDVEATLKGAQVSENRFAEFARDLLSEAKGQGDNDFKIVLAQRAIVRALTQAADGTPQSQTDKRIV